MKPVDPFTKGVIRSLVAALRLYLEQDSDCCGNRGRCMFCRATLAIEAARLVLNDRLS